MSSVPPAAVPRPSTDTNDGSAAATARREHPEVRIERRADGALRIDSSEGRRAPARRGRVRVGAHRAGTASLTLTEPGVVVPAAHLEAWAIALRAHGFDTVRSGALAAAQALEAEHAGWSCVQELRLLRLDGRPDRDLVRTPPQATTVTLHSVSPDDLASVARLAAIDAAAFGAPWQFDAAVLADVATATPSSRFRVAASGQEWTGFLVSGRAGRVGYVQRLAVDPGAQRQGIGRALLVDGLRWMRRWRVDQVYVNTHVDNGPALALYESFGFVARAEVLRVFESPVRT
jgi:ribosomal protein S18 acetylase RimI-like enzyme